MTCKKTTEWSEILPVCEQHFQEAIKASIGLVVPVFKVQLRKKDGKVRNVEALVRYPADLESRMLAGSGIHTKVFARELLIDGQLSKYKKIYVTGWARSGTRITTRMIAHDTGLEFIDETEWGVMQKPKLDFINKYQNNFVIQATSAYFFIDEYNDKDSLVVFVRRNVDDVRKSWSRLREDRLKSVFK